MTRIFFASIFVFCFSLCLEAQKAPGFMGKKTVISITSSLSPTILLPNKNGKKFPMAMNDKLAFTLERVHSRIGAWGVGYETFKTQSPLGFDIIVQNLGRGSYFYFSTSDYSNISTNVISLFHSIFKKGIAPLGVSRNYGLKLYFAETDMQNVICTGDNNSYQGYRYTSLPKSANSKALGFHYSSKHNKMISNSLIFSAGIELNIIPSALLSKSSGRSVGSTTSEIKNAIIENTNARIFAHQLFSFTAGLSFLAK